MADTAPGSMEKLSALAVRGSSSNRATSSAAAACAARKAGHLLGRENHRAISSKPIEGLSTVPAAGDSRNA